jgi:coenzyme F420-reducing hydrogenase delta subunit
MEEVYKQAPEGISYEEVEKIFNDNKQDVLKTLIELWKIPQDNIKNISEESSKWADIRNTCDDFDNEMKKVLDAAKKNK